MSKTARKVWKTQCEFSKQFKRPFRQLAGVMPDGFTDSEYVAAFKECFPHLWKELQKRFEEYQKRDALRERNHFKRVYNFPAPPNYVMQKAHAVICNVRHKGSTIPTEERAAQFAKLKEQGERKLATRKEKLRKNLELVQDVRPRHTNYFIKTYFDIKHHDPANVNERMLIIQEAGKYRCGQTIDFLYKVNSSERNYTLRNQTFLLLRKWDRVVEPHKNRKGKKRLGDTLIPVIAETPEQLLKQIYNAQMEKETHYDIFISHSSTDRDDILRLKTMLNAEGLSVYLDWMNDSIGLRRDLTNADTARVLIERIKKSTALLYIHTEASFNSRWTPWEISYADALGKKIAVYTPTSIKKPAYLDKYESAESIDGKFFIGNDKVGIKKWAKPAH